MQATWMGDLGENIGSSSAPIKSSIAGNFLGFNVENDSTGQSRGLYMRLYTGGAGASSEAVRAYNIVNGAGAVGVHGTHSSLAFGAAGTATGEGAAVRATLEIPNRAVAMGTLSAGYSEIYSDGSSSDPSGTTLLAVHRFVNAGDGTGMGKVDTSGVLFSLEGFTAANDTTKILSSVSLAELPTGTVGLRISVAGAMYRLPLVVESQWN